MVRARCIRESFDHAVQLLTGVNELRFATRRLANWLEGFGYLLPDFVQIVAALIGSNVREKIKRGR